MKNCMIKYILLIYFLSCLCICSKHSFKSSSFHQYLHQNQIGKKIAVSLTAFGVGFTSMNPLLNLNSLELKKALAVEEATTSTTTSTISSEYPFFDEVWNNVNDNFFDGTYNNNDWKKLKLDYENRLKSGADEHKLTEAMLKKLGDKYTRLLDKKTYESLWKYDAIGVGILFESDPNTKTMLISSSPISGSSAEKNKLIKGDRVYSINSNNMEGVTAIQLLDMLSNDDSNELIMEIGRLNTNFKKETVVLKRDKQKAQNPVLEATKKLKDGTNIGYIRLNDFNSEAVPGIKAAINKLDDKVNLYILDLRGNTGGGFQFALNIGGMFMNDKPMVTARGKEGPIDTALNTQVFKTSYPEGVLTKKPLLIWLDSLSASASEVLAGGLHDNCRGVTLGGQSFGKGKIQAVFGLGDGGGMTMTVAQYVTPKGTIIQAHGLTPDIPLEGSNAYLSYFMSSLGTGAPDLTAINTDIVKNAELMLQTCKVE